MGQASTHSPQLLQYSSETVILPFAIRKNPLHKVAAIVKKLLSVGEDFADSGKLPVLFTVGKDVIIADDYTENGAYSQLWTAHDCLFIRKKDVRRE